MTNYYHIMVTTNYLVSTNVEAQIEVLETFFAEPTSSLRTVVKEEIEMNTFHPFKIQKLTNL